VPAASLKRFLFKNLERKPKERMKRLEKILEQILGKA
jgi:hypothetical protein